VSPLDFTSWSSCRERAHNTKHVSSGLTSLTFIINVTESHKNWRGMEFEMRAEIVTMWVTIFREACVTGTCNTDYLFHVHKDCRFSWPIRVVWKMHNTLCGVTNCVCRRDVLPFFPSTHKCVSFHNSRTCCNWWEVIFSAILQSTERPSCQVDNTQKSMEEAGCSLVQWPPTCRINPGDSVACSTLPSSITTAES
jgi:hypothetical protein